MFRKNAFSTILAISALLAMTFAILLISTPANAGPSKVEVCHLPPGNVDNFHTIDISSKTLGAHLEHGDLAGACNGLCSTICDDGDACTVDDTGDCEVNGCPVVAEPVDCNDDNLCTVDSCNSAFGCSNVPVVCEAPDACSVAVCDGQTGGCEVTPVVCEAGFSCDPDQGGACLPDDPQTTVCPCFDAGTLATTASESGGAQCGELNEFVADATGPYIAFGDFDFLACAGGGCTLEPDDYFLGCSMDFFSATTETTAEQSGVCLQLIQNFCGN